MPETYEMLAEPFDTVFHDTRGGVEIAYITGEQCVSRLNEVLGVGGWAFAVKEHGRDSDADEIWVLGRLEAVLDGAKVVREQFGSQKIKRSRSSEMPLDIGFDLKGAATDALKKCASLLGVGLYLSRKESAAAEAEAPAGAEFSCTECGVVVDQEIRFRDGTSWSPEQLAANGRRKHGRALCMACYRAANQARLRGG